MANQPYVQGTVSVGTTATLIASPGPGGVYVYNNGSAAVVLGGSTVTATGATQGATLASGAGLILPSDGPAHDLYGITATGTASVSFVYPGGN